MLNIRNVLRLVLAAAGASILASIAAVAVMAGGAPPKQSGSPTVQTSGLTPVDNGQIVYDANQQVYWLANADLAADPTIRAELGVTGINPNGTMTFTTALQWVQALNHANNGVGYLGHTNWQLPVTPPTDPTCAVLAGTDGNSFGPNCTGSALGNLYRAGLNLTYPASVAPALTDTIGLFHHGLQPSLYWISGTQGSAGQKTFSFLTGLTGANTTKYNYFYVLPMVPGTIGTPAAGTGLVPYASNPAAGRAIYDTVANVTWALDADLAVSKHFGLTGTMNITDHGQVITVPVINASGAMLSATANEWLTHANNNSYAGTSNWMLPTEADAQTLFSHLGLQPGDSRLTEQGSAGPFHHDLQPFFYWACTRDQTGNSQSPCNGRIAGTNPGGAPMVWSFNLDTGCQGTDLETKAFYVEVYYPPPKAFLPVIDK